MTNQTVDRLLCLDAQTLAGLRWLKTWARSHITRLKRRRKYLPRGAPFDPAEADLLRALFDLEQIAGCLLDGNNAQISAREAPLVNTEK